MWLPKWPKDFPLNTISVVNDFESFDKNPSALQLKDIISESLKSINSMQLLLKLSDLREVSSPKAWEQYYMMAFDKLWITWKNFKESFNNFCKKYSVANTSPLIYQYNNEKKLNSYIAILPTVLEELEKRFFWIELKKVNAILKGNDDYRNRRVANKHNWYAYYAYLEWDIENAISERRKKVYDKIEDMKSWHISIDDCLELIKKIFTKTQREWDTRMDEKIIPLSIFENQREFINLSPSLFNETLFNNTIDSGIRFRLVENNWIKKIYAYTKDWIYIKSKELPCDDEKVFFESLVDEYGNTPIKGLVTVDTETVITPGSISDGLTWIVESFKIPKHYKKQIEAYKKEWYEFMVTWVSGNGFMKILISHKNEWKKSIVWSVKSKWWKEDYEYDLWLDIVVNTVESHKKNKVNEKKDNIEYNPSNINQNRINFVNEIFENTVWSKKGFNMEYLYVENLVEIGLKHKLPLDKIFNQIPQILEKIAHKNYDFWWKDFYAYSRQVLFSMLPNRPKFLQKFNITEKDYSKVNNAFTSMHYTIWQKVILSDPLWSLRNVVRLADHYLSREVNFSEDGLIWEDDKGIGQGITYIVRQVLSVDVNLKDSPEMQKLFKQYPWLEDLTASNLEWLREAQTLVSWLEDWWSISDFKNSVDQELWVLVYDDWINSFLKEKKPWVELSFKVKADLKLAVIRNMWSQYSNNMDWLKEQIRGWKWQELVHKNLQMIFDLRKQFWDKEMFSDFHMLHIAHYGQDIWFDSMWTQGTQDAFKRQSWDDQYTLFDWETIFKSDIDVWEGKLRRALHKTIMNPKPIMINSEWHWSSQSFSVLQKYSQVDKFGINRMNVQNISLKPSELADLIIKREEFKWDRLKPDFILFAACKWDYAINFYKELENRWFNWVPPIMMTAAEAWENSLFTTGGGETDVPYQVYKYVLNVSGDKPTTYNTFFDNQYHKKMWSNPSLFVPVKINWKWIPQQIW